MLASAIILIIFPLGTVALSQNKQVTPAASIKVTVAFFSGRNDPEWKLSPNTQQLAQILNEVKTKGYSPEQMPARLGYKGLLVVDLSTNEVRLLVGPDTSKLQLQLLKTIPKGLLKSGDIKEIEKDISSGKITAVEAPAYKGRGKRFAPPYEHQHWTAMFDLERKELCNNCYNYANRRPTYTFAQPGFASGQQFTQYTVVDLVTAAQRDGLLLLNPDPGAGDPVPGPPLDLFQHLVALVIRPDSAVQSGDHHWYSLDDNGLWSHKQGQSPVSNRDYGGAVILDPRTANLGFYVFAKFMVSDLHTLNIAGPRVCPY